MYFEDLYETVRPLWKDSFSLEGIEGTETFVKDMRENWNKLDDIIYFSSNDNKHKKWVSMFAYTMYQTLTAFALKKWKKEKTEILYFEDIPIELFDKYFRKNIEAEGNEEYLKAYKGFKNKYS